MKLLIVGNGSIGSHQNTSFYINNHTGFFINQIDKEHAVTFAEFGTSYNKDSNLQNFELIKNKIKFKVIPKIKSLKFLLGVSRLVRRNNLIYLFYPGSLSKLISLLAIFFKKPYGLYIRGEHYNRNKLDRFILKHAKFILTISPSFIEDLQRFCQKVDIIKPMIAIMKSDLKQDRDYSLPQEWNLLFVGRVEERKGIYELLEIVKKLKINGFKFKMNIVGGGVLIELLKKEIKTYNIKEEIIFHGLISDKDRLKKLYNQSNAFIFTSQDEGFPRVLYEAMASGLPIFTTFVGGIPGRMKHLENCVEIPVKSGDKAGRIIGKYLNEEDLLEKIGRNGQRTLEKIIDGSLLPHEELLLKQIEDEK